MVNELVPSLSFLADDVGAGAALIGSVALEKSAYFADNVLIRRAAEGGPGEPVHHARVVAAGGACTTQAFHDAGIEWPGSTHAQSHVRQKSDFSVSFVLS